MIFQTVLSFEGHSKDIQSNAIALFKRVSWPVFRKSAAWQRNCPLRAFSHALFRDLEMPDWPNSVEKPLTVRLSLLRYSEWPAAAALDFHLVSNSSGL